MKAFIALLVVGLLATEGLSAPFSGSGECTEQCIQFILSDATGPKVLRLYKELLKPDTGYTTLVNVNGQNYDVSPTKKNLIQNAIRKGVKESIIEGMLDDAAIVPSSSSTSSRTTQQNFDRPTRLEPVRERRPTTTTENHYRIYTKSNGDINIDIKGQTLKVPDDLTRLPDIVDHDTLIDIIHQLQGLGVPVNRDGSRVTIGSSSSPQGLTLRVSIKKIDDKPSSVTIMANNDKYTLPGDEYSLNRYLAREPEVAYHILRILSTHGVPVEYDAHTKTIKTTLTPEDDYIGSRTSLPTQSSTSNSHSSGLLVRPTSSSPKVFRVGGSTYYLPEDWDRLKKDLQDGRLSATSVMESLDTEHIAAPGDIISIIRTRINTSVGKVRVMRYGDEVTVQLGSQSFKLPQDDRALEKALRENDFPIELIRDSLLRIGIDSRRIGSNLRVVLPGGDAYLSGLPITRQYQYKIESSSGNVKVITGTDTYNLPSDKILLERAIAEKKVLPRTLVDTFNSVGISSQMDIPKQEMTVELPTGTLRIPVTLNVHQPKSSRLRLNVRGPEGNKVYTLTVGDSGDDKVELPSDVHVLNRYIRDGKIDSHLLMQLLGRMGVAHYVDSAKNVHVVTLNGRSYDIDKSSTSSLPHEHRQVKDY